MTSVSTTSPAWTMIDYRTVRGEHRGVAYAVDSALMDRFFDPLQAVATEDSYNLLDEVISIGLEDGRITKL